MAAQKTKARSEAETGTAANCPDVTPPHNLPKLFDSVSAFNIAAEENQNNLTYSDEGVKKNVTTSEGTTGGGPALDTLCLEKRSTALK